MLKPLDTGGTAFPSTGMGGYPGMTLRDWFAGQLLKTLGTTWPYPNASRVEVAREAYFMADAMLEARNGD